MDYDTHEISSALTAGQSSNLRVQNSSGSSLLKKHASTSAETNFSHEGQDKYAMMMAEMVEMQKTLEKMNTDLRKASVKCHMLNVDAATMFNPEIEEMLRKAVEDCEACTKKISALSMKEGCLPND